MEQPTDQEKEMEKSPPSYTEVVPSDQPDISGVHGGNLVYPKQGQFAWTDQSVSNQYPRPDQIQYPPASGSIPYASPYGQPMIPYYQQPGGCGPPCYGVPVSQDPQQQQQQQQVVLVGGQQHCEMYMVQQVQSFAGHIALSCVVIFCCNCLIGIVAFILAAIASSVVVSDPVSARKLGHASLGVSLGGIAVTIFIIIFIFGVMFSYGYY